MKWAVILAGGNGSRLQSLTRVLTGDDRPKQFCALLGGKTLLAETRTRIARNVSTTRTLCVVTQSHERYYRRELADLQPRQIIEQPANRGTAVAIAYGVSRVAREDQKAIVGLFPADHHYEDGETFRRTVDQAYRLAALRKDLVFLLGTEPDSPEVEYGWIEPGAPIDAVGGKASAVGRFWEKPSLEAAHQLFSRGCLWNMFVMIGSLGAFRTLLHDAVPDIAQAFDLVKPFDGAEQDLVERIFGSLDPADFSKDVLARQTDRIAVVRTPSIGWTDLGQPARVHSFMTAHGTSIAALSAAS